MTGDAVTSTGPVERPALAVVDLGIGVMTSVVGAPAVRTAALVGDLLRRGARRSRPAVDQLILRPPLVPRGLQPADVLESCFRRGRHERERAKRDLARHLDRWVPRLADELVRRLEFDAIVARIDIDAIVAGIDLDAIVARIDLGRLAQTVIADVDLPEIIRESTTAVSSDAVREVRMRGISGDEAVARAVDRLLLRHRRAAAGGGTSP
jgi:hypothetical protein